jgi:hypothetical protein
VAPAQLAQGACVALLVGWLLLLRLRGDYRDACDGVPNPWSACAAALLSLLALAWLLTPQFIDNLVETAAWQQAGGRWLASVLVGARLVAAWALWRRWRRAPAVAALVAIVASACRASNSWTRTIDCWLHSGVPTPRRRCWRWASQRGMTQGTQPRAPAGASARWMSRGCWAS